MSIITKQQLAAAIAHECDVCVHLHGKLPAGALSYRPSDGQRTTLDLLRYLASVGIGAARSLADGDWKHYREASARVAEMAGDGFPAAMERQKREIVELLDGMDDETLRTREAKVPGGATMPLGAAIMNGPLKYLTAYKLQLFLYAKAAGAAGIGTVNAWAGMDAPPA